MAWVVQSQKDISKNKHVSCFITTFAFYFCFHLQFCLWGYTVPTGTFLFCFVLVSLSGLPNNLEGSGQFKMNVNIFWQTNFILFLLQSYFKDNWNTFDFVTVVGSIVDALMVEFAVSINICVANIRKGFESFSTVSSLSFFRLLYALKIAQAHAGYNINIWTKILISIFQKGAIIGVSSYRVLCRQFQYFLWSFQKIFYKFLKMHKCLRIDWSKIKQETNFLKLPPKSRHSTYIYFCKYDIVNIPLYRCKTSGIFWNVSWTLI